MNFVERRVSPPGSATADLPERRRPEHKWLISYRSIEPIALASDVVTVFFSAVLSGVIYHLESIGTSGDIIQYVGSAAVVSALFISLMVGRNLYNPAELLDVKTQIHSVAVIWIGVFLFLAGVVFALKIGGEFSRGAVLFFAASGLSILLAERMFWYFLLRRGLARQRFSGRDVVLISGEPPTSGFVATLAKHGFQLNQRFVLPNAGDDAMSQIVSYLREAPEIEDVLVSAELDGVYELVKRLAPLRELPITVSFIPVGTAAKILTRPSTQIGDTICIELQRKPLNSIELTIKRGIDVVFALTGLVALLPLLIITAIAIKLDSPGPVLFRQRRCGFNGKQFYILKFRTMSVMEDGQSISQAARHDNRVTRLGRWLRRASIDELPQLLNVLSGSMSLVGPRPHAVAHDNEFDKVVRHYALRHHVKPGLTGWAQVHGCRGPTPTAAAVQRRVEYDLWYIDNWSLGLDWLIMARTAIEILRGRNAY
ncbi:MAG: undecaprenyl-phosphate glucose phosphotransferase [Xanthobacteraceae bacterium]